MQRRPDFANLCGMMMCHVVVLLMASADCILAQPKRRARIYFLKGIGVLIGPCKRDAMSSKITLVQLSDLCGVPAVSLHQWISGKRVRLSTRYQRAQIGPARGGRFSFDNCVEVCLIAAQAKANVPLVQAAARTRGV